MRLLRLAAVVVLVGLLATSVAAGNAVVAAERTVLSGPFVKATLEETDAYGTVREFVVEQATVPANETEESGVPSGPFGEASGRIVGEAVTEAYLQRETERNVDRTYGYLHGEREELVVAIDLEPVQDQVVGILEEEIRNASLVDLFGAVGSGGTSLPVAGTEVNMTTVGAMAESPEAYESTRAGFRADLREAAVDELVNQSYDAASDDERLALAIPDYDPDAYTEAEKTEMVETREDDIRAAIGERIEAERGDEVDAAVNQQLDALAAVDGDVLATQLDGTGDDLPPGVVTPVADLAATGVAGLATDMPYETFAEETDDAKARLAANVTAMIEDQIEAEGTDQSVLLDTREPGSAEGFETARQAVGVVDLLSMLLPLLSLALVGMLWLLTRSVAVTAGGTGVGLVGGGLPGYVLADLAPDLLAETVAGGEVPEAFSGLLFAVVDAVLGVLAAQSLALVVAGVGLVLVSGYLAVYGAPAWASGLQVSERASE